MTHVMLLVCCGRLTHDRSCCLDGVCACLTVSRPCPPSELQARAFLPSKFRLAEKIFKAVKTSQCQAQQRGPLKSGSQLPPVVSAPPNSGTLFHHWGFQSLCHLTKWVMECWGAAYVLSTVQMACPDQACSLQGALVVRREHLAVKDLGIDSGWQQSK